MKSTVGLESWRENDIGNDESALARLSFYGKRREIGRAREREREGGREEEGGKEREGRR